MQCKLETKKFSQMQFMFIHHDVVNKFDELFPAIVVNVPELSNTNRAISTTTSSLLANIKKGSFILSLLVCEHVFSFTLPLSNYLPNPQHDLASAVKYADDNLDKLQELHISNSSDCWV
ncbi:hypothetical protein PR048_011010 [Dryococelus australis]|uniref:Uncharacterized protein n=1 Tax=Dryococelus australis TaxID=614101 RepID=A0ABQ9HKY0_9NEOP|nr:hypothetical protein PR048_011010 [Dryococelus australis]